MDNFVRIKIWTWAKSKQKDDKSGLAFNLLQISIKKGKFIREIRHARVKSIEEKKRQYL